MANKIHPETTSSTAIKAIGFAKGRTFAAIHNISGETCYHADNGQVDSTHGAPIFNNGRAVFSFDGGSNPEIERWVIGSAGGTIIIEEEFSQDPFITLMKSLLTALDGLRTAIGRLVK